MESKFYKFTQSVIMLRLSGAIERRSTGKNPSVAVSSDGVVVEVHKPFAASGNICYQVGKINGDEVEFHEEKGAGTGMYPKVAIYNDYVVKVHEGRMLRRIYYDFGRVDETLRIAWKTHIHNSPVIGSGRLPAVAIHGNRAVITYDSAIGYNTFYRIGTIDEQGESVNWGEEHKLFQFGATETSVALNQQHVVSAGQGWTKIRYLIGRIVEQNRPHNEQNRPHNEQNRPHNEQNRPHNEQNRAHNEQNRPHNEQNGPHIEKLLEVKYDHIGYHPSLCMDNEGYIIMMWQSRSRHLSYVNGQVIIPQDPHRAHINWKENRRHDFGYNPAIAISANNNHVMEEHETNIPLSLVLFYRTGVLQKQPAQEVVVNRDNQREQVDDEGRLAGENENGGQHDQPMDHARGQQQQ